MLFVLFFTATLVAAYPLSTSLWAWGGASDEALGPFENASSIGLLTLATAVAVDWALALAHIFTGSVLTGASVALLLAGFSGRRWATLRVRLGKRVRMTREGLLVALAVVPFVLWVSYAFVRGTIVFPFASDALAYHLPKALCITRAHAYGFFDGPDARLPTFPADYEMLLADVFALTGSDGLTGAVGTLSYVLFGAVVAGVAERWWGRGALHIVAPSLFAVAMPTVILHSVAHKNDLLCAACVLASVHWAARWAAHGERAGLTLAMVSASLAVGTKISGGVLVGALLPLAVWRARRWWSQGGSPSLRDAALGSVAGPVLFLLLGGVAYVTNVLHTGHPLGASNLAGYGDWKDLWMFPYLVFARPLSAVDASWVPWKHEYWFWPEWDMFFSTYGLQTTLALFAMPFAIARYRKVGRPTERALASLAALVAWLMILPTRLVQPPVGFFEGLVRYTHFFPPVLLLWTVAPFVQELGESTRGRALALAGVLASGVTYGCVAANAAMHDAYAPVTFVAAVFADPRYSRAIRSWTVRSASWVDANAGPEDVIAFDGAFDTWSYPAFGAELSRRVLFLHSDGQEVKIPDDANWVAVDRSWHCAFGHPKFADFGEWSKYILRGRPLPEDLIVFQQLLGDARFKLVYRDERFNQAVFKRVVAAETQ
jgi:hypothetical protein